MSQCAMRKGCDNGVGIPQPWAFGGKGGGMFGTKQCTIEGGKKGGSRKASVMVSTRAKREKVGIAGLYLVLGNS